jgi:hypothetical protein
MQLKPKKLISTPHRPRHAAKIVAYREKNGPFKMPEELTQVSGIGQKTLEANQEIIIVEDPKPKKE